MTYSVLYVLVYLPYMVNFVNTFGADIFSSPLAFLEGFEGLESGISILGALLLESFAHMAISLGALTLVLLLSEMLENTVTAMIASTAAALIPCVLIYFNSDVRLFSLLMNNKLYIICFIVAVSLLAAVISGMLTYKSFTKKTVHNRRSR